MPFVHVCSLARIATTVSEARASHLVSLINDDTAVIRPEAIAEENHLFLGINDITEPQDGLVLPGEEHVQRLIAFADGWHRQQPMVIHCFAGISRSTAAAFITLCATRPERDERDIARRLRAASAIATPNALLVALADDILDRRGRMIEAIAAIGRGEMAIEGVPFALALEEPA
jgi:predicted protein tyrosine phosphatase